jgi:LysR family glycine cleavage system transcriptional activator
MSQRLPPLENFRFFDAAARHLNFSRAAEELYVTHGAVSQRIKALEDELRVRLFKRQGRLMLLTAAGQELHTRVQTALAEITRAVNIVRSGGLDLPLTVNVLPAFATRWLIPRLGGLNADHPNLHINIRASHAFVDFDRDGVDIAIRFGAGIWPGLKADKLFDDVLVPVCSPQFPFASWPTRPEQLLTQPLLHDERQPWTIWFNAMGIDAVRRGGGPVYADGNLLLEAAIARQGLALARMSFVKPDLDGGRLVKLFDRGVRTRFSYYLVYPLRSQGVANIQIFKDWLHGEATAWQTIIEAWQAAPAGAQRETS